MCNIKTLLKVVLGMGLLLLLAYVAFPQSHALIVAFAPYLLFLACPLAMFFMMKGMNTPPAQEKNRIGKTSDSSLQQSQHHF